MCARLSRISPAGAECEIIATQDCDVASFRRADLARLCYAVAHPQLGYRFAKMYYIRVTDRLYGRVSRLFLAPLLHAVVRVAGHMPLVDFLLSFRYPLAGEVAMTRELAAALPRAPAGDSRSGSSAKSSAGSIRAKSARSMAAPATITNINPPPPRSPGWRRRSPANFSPNSPPRASAATRPFAPRVAAAYRREAAHALRRCASLALINGLPFDGAAEAAIVETFAARLG